MPSRTVGIAILAVFVACVVGVEGVQRSWLGLGKKQTLRPTRATSTVGPVVGPRASIGGGANGVYCTAPWTNGIAVHDLGFMPAGFNITVTVESFSENFNPVAAVVVPALGQLAGNTIKTTTFYDDDSGGDQDPRLEFVAPQDGTYLLMVNDLTDGAVGCYRYQVMAR
ncbi:MAG: hypothetical protein ACRD3C_13095 [Vicinamibacterales bacterium]